MMAAANMLAATLPAPAGDAFTRDSLIVGRGELCQILGISMDTLERRMKAGELPPGFRLGRNVYWHRDTLLNAIKAASEK